MVALQILLGLLVAVGIVMSVCLIAIAIELALGVRLLQRLVGVILRPKQAIYNRKQKWGE